MPGLSAATKLALPDERKRLHEANNKSETAMKLILESGDFLADFMFFPFSAREF